MVRFTAAQQAPPRSAPPQVRSTDRSRSSRSHEAPRRDLWPSKQERRGTLRYEVPTVTYIFQLELSVLSAWRTFLDQGKLSAEFFEHFCAEFIHAVEVGKHLCMEYDRGRSFLERMLHPRPEPAELELFC